MNEELIENVEEINEETVGKKPAKVVKKKSVIKVKVTHPYLNIRTGPGASFARTGKFTGIGEFEISEIQNGFGKLKTGEGWISMDYTERV